MGCMKELDTGVSVCAHCGFDKSQYVPPEMTLPLGSVLNDGKYLIGKTLGQGGFGVTYIALDRFLKLRVAIKEYLPKSMAYRNENSMSLRWHSSMAEQKLGRDSFVKEAQKMAQMDDIPGIVRVREVFYENSTAYIVMDYVEGETLLRRLETTGALDGKACFELLRPVMDSLVEAHQQGMIHRDISPDNIMLDRRGRVWLLDMGAAKEINVAQSGQSAHPSSVAVVKNGFSPLEQYAGDPVTGKKDIGAWTDVYAMSATIFYCMSLSMLPPAPNRVLNPRLELPDIIPPNISQLLLKGLAVMPKERIQSMEELRDAFAAAVDAPDEEEEAQRQEEKQRRVEQKKQEWKRKIEEGRKRAKARQEEKAQCQHMETEYDRPENALPPGSLLANGRYQVGRVLGQGGFGITYIALDKSLDVHVAIKEYMPIGMAYRTGDSMSLHWNNSIQNRQAGRDSFVMRAQKMAKVKQIPGLVQVRNVFLQNDTAYIAMDFIDGETLGTRLRKTGKMDAKSCFYLLAPIMESLEAAHQQGIVHRDISPSNIMLDSQNRVWLLNMGPGEEMVIRNGFSPLEQYTDKTNIIGSWTDVYAMSATFFYCTSGQIPPPATDRVTTARPLEIPDTIPSKVAEVLKRGLALRPDERIQSMEELRTQLESAVNGMNLLKNFSHYWRRR